MKHKLPMADHPKTCVEMNVFDNSTNQRVMVVLPGEGRYVSRTTIVSVKGQMLSFFLILHL